jgi:hypothetical protein
MRNAKNQNPAQAKHSKVYREEKPHAQAPIGKAAR